MYGSNWYTVGNGIHKLVFTNFKCHILVHNSKMTTRWKSVKFFTINKVKQKHQKTVSNMHWPLQCSIKSKIYKLYHSEVDRNPYRSGHEYYQSNQQIELVFVELEENWRAHRKSLEAQERNKNNFTHMHHWGWWNSSSGDIDERWALRNLTIIM